LVAAKATASKHSAAMNDDRQLVLAFADPVAR